MDQMIEVKEKAATEAKKVVMDYTNAAVWDNATSDQDRNVDHLIKIEITKAEVDTYIDLDLVPVEYEQFLIKSAYRAFYFEKGKTSATVYWFQSCALTKAAMSLLLIFVSLLSVSLLTLHHLQILVALYGILITLNSRSIFQRTSTRWL